MTERDEQQALFEWAEWAGNLHPELRLLYAVPNGGDRHPAVAAKLKAEGVRAGVPDICLPVARGPYHGAYLELKYGGNQPTAAQIKWMDRLQAHGYFCAVARGFDEARRTIEWYIGLEVGE